MTYVELHAKSFHSFGLGASHGHELLAQARTLGMSALAQTDTNLCGALEFARLANSLEIQPITGGEITLQDDSRVALLVKSREGYANLSRLFTLANTVDRREPRLDPAHLSEHAEGLVLLAGGRHGALSRLTLAGERAEARELLGRYRDWYGADSVYVELQQNFLRGDTERNRELVGLTREVGAPLVASNDVHYHSPERYRLQHALVAAKRNVTIDQALRQIQPNHHLHLKSAAQMAELFSEFPEAVCNTRRVAEQCAFNLSVDLGYTLPEPIVPEGYTPESYLRRLCEEAAARRYGSVTPEVGQRLDEEFNLIGRHKLAGFLLLYREIVRLAQRIMEERGLAEPETPLEKRPPGRGRGSSVALLVGYLIGISHVDPLKWELTLERFLPDDMTSLPDIDLDFPRGLRDELIERVHEYFGRDYAVLTGAISTYSVKGIIQDLGKALGLPPDDLRLLSKQIHSHDGARLREEMEQLPAFRDRVEAHGWRDLIALAPQLMNAPRGLGQHVGGMILSDSPIPEMVPVRAGAMDGRFIMDWNKDSVADANFAKIDLLSLPVLDQLEEALDLVEQRSGERPDLSQLSPEDDGVYDMINAGKSKGIFLLQSPAQLKMGQRLRSRKLLDLAYQVALIRPGVGTQGSAVSQFVDRYRHGVEWEYDHPLEARALERGYGVIVWQEQVVQLIMDVAGMSAAEADEVRRAFARANNEHLIAMHRERFFEGARANGVPDDAAETIFGKINGHYMFPESHSHAFAITAYQAAWLKRYHPLEFFVTLINNQPMGFYPVETLKEDARKFGVHFLNPCVNRSEVRAVPDTLSPPGAGGDAVATPSISPRSAGGDAEGRGGQTARLGLGMIKDIGPESAKLIVAEREARGPYADAGELVRRTGLKPQSVRSLIEAGAFDAVTPNRREAFWEAGLSIRPARSGQRAFPVHGSEAPPRFDDFTDYEKMVGEYKTLGIYPSGHVMEFIRPTLDTGVLTTAAVYDCEDGARIRVAGWPIARQHPRGQDGTVFVTIEDETGDVQSIVWPKVFARCRRALSNQLILLQGRIDRWDGTTNIVAERIDAIGADIRMPSAHDWH
ncbi:MAG: DNA polymerase III subunit alpha [Chloroflexi bacterium]|nr:DNA polymerase III subunit alpha [Chloroflexota bacterium]MCY3696613.1 DNA polymerase III subunit alpha [Chloroflexota bacterium]